MNASRGTGQLIIGCVLSCVVLVPPRHGLAQSDSLRTSFCEVRQHPERFIGKRVSFHARVLSDGIERTVLVNEVENVCQGGIVPITDAASAASKVADEKLVDALSTGGPGTLDKEITATFTGLLSMGEPEQYMLAPGRKIPVLTVEAVENIRIQPKPEGKAP